MKRDIVYRENCWVRFGKLGGVPSSPFSLTASAQTDGPILPAVWLCGSVSGTPPPPGLTHLFLYFSCLLPPPLPHGCRGNVTREALLALHPLSPGSPPPFRGGLSLQPSLALAGGDSFVEGAIPGPPPPPGPRPFLGSPPPSCREEVPRVVSVGAPRLVWLKCAHLMWCQCLFGCGEQRGWSASSLGLVASRRILSGSVEPGTHLPPLLIV